MCKLDSSVQKEVSPEPVPKKCKWHLVPKVLKIPECYLRWRHQ